MNKSWFKFSYLSSIGVLPQEKLLVNLLGEVIINRFILIEDTVEQINTVWIYLKAQPGYIKRGAANKLSFTPSYQDKIINLYEN